MLRQLLTINKSISQKNGLIVTGTALEIAFKCWDWSSVNQEEMVEMLMRYMRMLPGGEEIIQNTIKKLFPNGKDSHFEAQKLVRHGCIFLSLELSSQKTSVWVASFCIMRRNMLTNGS